MIDEKVLENIKNNTKYLNMWNNFENTNHKPKTK